MASYGAIVLYLALAEVIRRVFLSVLSAYTGPLSKIPGPFLCKFSMLPWAYLNLTGNTMNVQHRWIKKYGPVVRIGVFLLRILRARPFADRQSSPERGALRR